MQMILKDRTGRTFNCRTVGCAFNLDGRHYPAGSFIVQASDEKYATAMTVAELRQFEKQLRK